jgi:FkbM family methyltransferase
MNSITWLSEEGNDRWIAEIFDYKSNGFFVDAGATGGKNNSAIVLEKQLKWRGISINANGDHYNLIINGQKRMNVEHAALLDYDGETEFYYVPIGVTSETVRSYNGNLQDLSYASCVTKYKNRYSINDLLQKSKIETVKCLTLHSLLKKYKAPTTIEYLALDIEGAEYDVLRVFPFNEYKILCLSVENSEKVQSILELNDFTRVKNPYCPKPHEHHYVNNCMLKEYPF